MNKMRLLTLAVTGLLLLNFGLLGFLFLKKDHPPERERRAPHEEPRNLIIRRLKLDGAQQAAYQVLIDDHRSHMNVLNRQSLELKNELYSLLREEKPDTMVATALIRKIGGKQEAIEHVNFGHFRQIRALCRPEQLPAFDSLAKELAGIFAPPHPPHPPKP